MANNRVRHPEFEFQPLYPVTLVCLENILEIPPDSVVSDIVGEKAFGLSCLPRPWTLPFFVVSDNLIRTYNEADKNDYENILNAWEKLIISSAISVGIKVTDQIIVRSSACSEGLDERGRYHSTTGTLGNIIEPLSECINKIIYDTGVTKQGMPLVIQKFAVPNSAKGHLSNERRCYEEKRDWLGEFEDIRKGIGKPFKINLRNWRKQISILKFIDKPLECNLTAHVSEVLKIPATWGNKLKQRLHFEWVWDGRNIFIVQADLEQKSNGIDPRHSRRKRHFDSIFVSKFLKEIDNNHANRYEKIRNVFTYKKLGLPITKIYVLDDQAIIQELAIGSVPVELERDLEGLVKKSLVIRMDVATDDVKRRQLLPRTHEVREISKAIRWLKDTSVAFKKAENRDDVAFIFHNFIPAVSSAFCYAAPGMRKVQIEALWGLPEGLYYNSHDKYIVDTLTPRIGEIKPGDIDRFFVQVKTSYKHFFIIPDTDGHWKTHVLKRPFDWKESIEKREWVKQIALESRRIAEEEGKSLSIMWFVGVPPDVCTRPIMPWHHEPFDLKYSKLSRSLRTKTPFDKSLVIKATSDIEILRREAEKPKSNIRRIRIQPFEESLLRDKNTLRIIGELACKIDAVILLEGGVLSHAYYQLMDTKAVVEVLHPFDDFEDKREFNKLVRDKVPDNIEYGGEIVRKSKLSGEFFLRALREKLIEESFEVLDATDQDTIVGELADVSEVIEAILSLLRVRPDEMRQRKEKKREKAGGFKHGIVLVDTRNPLPTKSEGPSDTLFDEIAYEDTSHTITADAREIIKPGHMIEKWGDKRDHKTSTEIILRLVVPVVTDNWKATTSEMELESGSVGQAKIIGKRFGAKLQVEISIFTPHTQLKLF